MTSSRGCSASLIVIALTGLCATAVNGADIHAAHADHQGRRYSVRVDAQVSASQPDVRRLLTDYNHLGRLNPSIKTSEILLQRTPRDLRVRTVTKVCVWVFCKRLLQVQDVTESDDGALTAVVIPELSDFRYGYARVRVWPEPAGTRVLLSGELEPDFWIPPFIGPWMIKRKLLDEALLTIGNLERVAPLPALPHNSAPSDEPTSADSPP